MPGQVADVVELEEVVVDQALARLKPPQPLAGSVRRRAHPSLADPPFDVSQLVLPNVTSR